MTDPGRFGAALLGLFLGQFVGDKSATISKMALASWSWWVDKPYSLYQVAGGSLYVILIFGCTGALFGALAARRKWATIEQVVTSTSIAVLVAFFSIVDFSLPSGTGTLSMDFWEPIYYLGWIVGLWYVPLFLLPMTGGAFAVRLRRGASVMAVAATLTILCLAAGFLLEIAVTQIGRLDWLGSDLPWQDTRRFWIARPHAINAIYGSIFVVAFVNTWWRDIWPADIQKYRWTLSVVALSSAYSGLYGVRFYGLGGAPVEQFVAFGVLPTAGVAALLFTCGILRRTVAAAEFGWPVSTRFWLVFCIALAVSLGLSAFFGLALLLEEGATDKRLSVLVLLHGVNGLLLGWVLRLMRVVSVAVCSPSP